MRKLILRWLFGTDDIDNYCKLLYENREYIKRNIKELDDHIESLESNKKDLIIIRKLIKICENHGIDVDKEIKNIEL